MSSQYRADAVGTLRGRGEDGRYLYDCAGPAGGTVFLTHRQRLDFVRWRKVIEQHCDAKLLLSQGPCCTRVRRWCYMWPAVIALDEHAGRRLAHELVHCDNIEFAAQATKLLGKPSGGLDHDTPGWKERETYWYVKLALATADWTKWPRHFSRLRDSMAPTASAWPAQRKERLKARMKAKAASVQPVDVWEKRRQRCAMRVAQWERRIRSAERKVSKWTRALRLAERKVKLLKETDNG